jgi:predicted MFS family arabinose efflux permease
MFDFSHPAFRPLWVRLLVVAVALGWALNEAVGGNPGWALIFGAIGAVAVWGLLFTYDPDRTRKEERK